MYLVKGLYHLTKGIDQLEEKFGQKKYGHYRPAMIYPAIGFYFMKIRATPSFGSSSILSDDNEISERRVGRDASLKRLM